MMKTPKRGYAPKIIASNFLQLSESQISSLYLKNTKNSKPQKSSPLTHGFGRGITAQRTTKGSHKFPPSNPQEQGLENTPRKSPREGSENHHQEQPGTTHPNLDEPC
jgi:hypothetical protein